MIRSVNLNHDLIRLDHKNKFNDTEKVIQTPTKINDKFKSNDSNYIEK